jgi:anti-anti-sigma factor
VDKTYALTHERVSQGLLLRAGGKFDRDAGGAIEEVLKAQAQSGDVVVLTMSDVEYISSSGVAALVKLSASQGVRLAALAECVKHTIGLAGIEPILHIYESESGALDAAG